MSSQYRGSEFPIIGGVPCIRVDGYFNQHNKTKVPFTSTTHNYYVEHVDEPQHLDESETKLGGTELHAIIMSKNTVKKMKIPAK